MSHPLTESRQQDLNAENEAVAAVLAADTSRANGDDAALVDVPGGLACVSTDTAIEGVHLHERLSPTQMGHRAAACAISDIVAMAAVPRFVVCAISVPRGRWADVPAIADGVRTRAGQQGADLVGGDVVAAASHDGDVPLSITITVIGVVSGSVCTRTAREGDAVYVTGTLGAAAAGLRSLEVGPTSTDNAYVAPPRRERVARAIGRYATGMIDISDGIAADLPRLLPSGLGCAVVLSDLPIAAALLSHVSSAEEAAVTAATFGDDYELLFSVAPAAVRQLQQDVAAVDPDLSLTCLGTVSPGSVSFVDATGTARALSGHQHS